jgi:hypothetical protein
MTHESPLKAGINNGEKEKIMPFLLPSLKNNIIAKC